MITCKSCFLRQRCIERGDKDAISGETDVTKCHSRMDESRLSVIDLLVQMYLDGIRTNEPVYVYRICPKCNAKHEGSCKNCAWNGVISNCGCTTFGLWGDGQYDADNCTIVKRRIIWNEIPTLAEHYLTRVFLTEQDAKLYLEAQHDA